MYYILFFKFSFINCPCCPDFPLGPLETRIHAYEIPYKPSKFYQTHPSNICLLKTRLSWREPFFLWSTKVKVVNSHIPQILWSRGCAPCISWSLLDYYASWSSFNILISWYLHLHHWKLQRGLYLSSLSNSCHQSLSLSDWFLSLSLLYHTFHAFPIFQSSSTWLHLADGSPHVYLRIYKSSDEDTFIFIAFKHYKCICQLSSFFLP